MKKRWKEILLIVVSATIILGMGSTAINNAKNIFKGNEEEKPTEETASIVHVEEEL